MDDLQPKIVPRYRGILIAVLVLVVAAKIVIDRTPDRTALRSGGVPLSAQITPPVTFDLQGDLRTYSEQDITARFRSSGLACAAEPRYKNLGERVCWFYPSSFNGIKTGVVAFFFISGRLSYLRVQYPPDSHLQVHQYLSSRFDEVKSKRKQRLKIFAAEGGYLAVMNSLTFDIGPSIFTWMPMKPKPVQESSPTKRLLSYQEVCRQLAPLCDES